ncbi:AAA family ATPase [Candidatus Woesearchaeota archaeon]|nr:AAA family ATPase [Candidatus Woesearchaeota archaeon]
MNKIIYFSGCHGSGKTTLINELVKRNPDKFIKFVKIPVPKSEDLHERIKVRLVRYYLQPFYQQEMSENNPSKYVLGDRCIIDSKAYLLGFLEIGWINKKEFDEFSSIEKSLFNGNYPKNIVFVNPTLEEAIANIKNRWKHSRKKYREEDFGYLEATINGFRKLYSDKPVLRLEVMDLDKRVELCNDWITNLPKHSSQKMTALSH